MNQYEFESSAILQLNERFSIFEFFSNFLQLHSPIIIEIRLLSFGNIFKCFPSRVRFKFFK